MNSQHNLSAAPRSASPSRNPLRAFKREEGQAAFEFVLMLPLFILFLLLLIDFGILMYEYVAVSNAAREGARYGSVNCSADCVVDPADPFTLIRTRTAERSSGVIADPLEVTVSWPDGVSRGDAVAVRVDHEYSFLFFPFSIPVISCAEMRLEQADFLAPVGGLGCG